MSKTVLTRTRFGIVCPHCQSSAKIRSSEMVSLITRRGYIECKNIQCGWRGRFSFSLESTITQASQPNASINLPIITP